jgi:hypothetical protein
MDASETASAGAVASLSITPVGRGPPPDIVFIQARSSPGSYNALTAFGKRRIALAAKGPPGHWETALKGQVQKLLDIDAALAHLG